MKSLVAVAPLLLLACGDDGGGTACDPGEAPPAPPGLDPAIEARVEALLAQMTLEEKIAQMHGRGVATSAAELWTTADNERLGVPGFRMTDGPRGVTALASTAFPVGMARGATFDVALEREVGAAIGLETRAHGADVILAPTVNVLRHPAWGRAQETYGEDPHHMAEMGLAFVDGAQQHAIAVAKHFACNSIEDTRFDVSVNLDERALREVYLPHFERLVREGEVGAVMSAYNKINGVYAGEQPHLLREVLKDEWGFAGPVMSDWIFGTRSGAPAVEAGLDIEMPSNTYFMELRGAVERCELPVAFVDDAVRRILRAKLRFGLDDLAPVAASVIESPEHVALALQAARESIVLLKNAGDALPLDPDSGTVAVIGALADTPNIGDEGSSDVNPAGAVVTPLDGLVTRLGAGRIVHVDADALDDTTRPMVAAADAAVVVVGLTHEDEGENLFSSGGDRDTLALSAAHRALIAEVAAASPRTIVVLEGGSALLTSPWIDDVEAVLMAWYPGMAGGTALAELLVGDVAPSGRLPISFPVADADLPPFDHVSFEVDYGLLHGYRWLDDRGTAAAFPFGFGLSYGTVDYLGVSVGSDGTTVTATVLLDSIDRTGAEVVQLYVEPPAVDGVERAPRELRAFARVPVTAGEGNVVELSFPIEALRRWGDDGWVVDPGTYTVAVGPNAGELPWRATFEVP